MCNSRDFPRFVPTTGGTWSALDLQVKHRHCLSENVEFEGREELWVCVQGCLDGILARQFRSSFMIDGFHQKRLSIRYIFNLKGKFDLKRYSTSANLLFWVVITLAVTKVKFFRVPR